jgi:hypothetical protein
MLDKGRATLEGKHGEYKYGCPLDQRLLDFAGLEAEAVKTQLALAKSDGEILDWIKASSKTKPTAEDIQAWSAMQDQRGPSDADSQSFFNDLHVKIAPRRQDITSWFDLLDLDDFVSFGGKP